MSSIKLKDIWKIYGHEVEAVRNLQLDIKNGEFVSLLGPSGCGKSSTLRMIAGLEEITKGNLYFDDTRMNDIEPGDRNLSMVFENYALFPHMTAYDNIAFPLTVRKFNRIEIDKRVKEISNLLDLDDLLNVLVVSCGGGEKQRIGIARAFIRKGEALLMDEPISHLDYELRMRTRGELARLQRLMEITTIYVTHDQAEALAMSDRIAVLNFGELQQFGTPEELYDSPENLFVAGFIGEPPMNFIPCTYVRQSDGHRFYTENMGFDIKLNGNKGKLIDEKYNGRNVVFGFRPHEVEIVSEANRDGNTITKAAVFNFEPGCEHSYVLAKICDIDVLFECPQNVRVYENKTVYIDIISKNFHVFDRESGKSILTRQNSS